MRIALYPGTFDPITSGHLDLIVRALRLFDRVVVAVGTGRDKAPMFSLEERQLMAREAVAELGNVEVVGFSGLLVDAVDNAGATAIVRGLRAISDFEYEFKMALMNRRLSENVETVFLMPSERYTYLDSTIVKEVAMFGGDVSGLVPEGVRSRLALKRTTHGSQE